MSVKTFLSFLLALSTPAVRRAVRAVRLGPPARPIRRASLANRGAVRDDRNGWWFLHVPEGVPTKLETRCEPADATDFIHWYVGNGDVVGAIDERNLVVGTISTKTVFGRERRFDSTVLEARDSSATNLLFKVKIVLDPKT